MDYRPFGLLDMTPGFPAGGVTGRTPAGADDLGRLLYSMTGAGGAQDAVGLLGGPSVRENLRAGNNFDAGLQMLAALPVVGMLGTAGKVARGAQDAAKATEEARGIIAYHGSPHSFDKFDLSKIGTGEGAQAYGHGLYFAENEDVARGYRNRLSLPTINGVPVSEISGARAPSADDAFLASILAHERTPQDARFRLDRLNRLDLMEKLDNMVAEGQVKPGGSMYQVRIDADPNAFLDWDKPISEQSRQIRERVTPFIETPLFGTARNLMIERANVPDIVNLRSPEVTKELNKLGIPGIKYLDQGSRSAGEGSRNYVVFDDSLIDILKKYGLIGLLGGGAAASGMSGMNNPAAAGGGGAPGL